MRDRGHRPGVSRIALTAALVAVVAVAGIALYVTLAPSKPSSSTSPSSSSTTTTQTSSSTNSSTGSGASSLALAMSPASPLIAPGQTQNYSLLEVTTLGSGLDGALTLGASAPAGISVALNETSVSLADDPQSIPVTLEAASSLSPGNYSVTIEAASAGLPALNQTFTVDVVPALVIMQNFAFHPQNITVPVGTRVYWMNLDSNIGCCDPGEHDVSFLSAGNMTSPLLARLETWSYTFGSAGVINYYCTIHPYMKARVTVTA